MNDERGAEKARMCKGDRAMEATESLRHPTTMEPADTAVKATHTAVEATHTAVETTHTAVETAPTPVEATESAGIYWTREGHCAEAERGCGKPQPQLPGVNVEHHHIFLPSRRTYAVVSPQQPTLHPTEIFETGRNSIGLAAKAKFLVWAFEVRKQAMAISCAGVRSSFFQITVTPHPRPDGASMALPRKADAPP
jgi:hypothetical protein